MTVIELVLIVLGCIFPKFGFILMSCYIAGFIFVVVTGGVSRYFQRHRYTRLSSWKNVN